MGERERLALFNMIAEYLPGAKVLDAFAGLEDQAEAPAEGEVTPAEGNGKLSGIKRFIAKFKDFKKSLKGLSDFQKLLLLTIAVVLPAGMFISVALLGFFNRKK